MHPGRAGNAGNRQRTKNVDTVNELPARALPGNQRRAHRRLPAGDKVLSYPDLAGKVAVVPAGSGRTRAASCRLLAANGAKVVAAAAAMP